jgi:hypothetical protein
MTEQEKKEVQVKMTTQTVAKVAYLMQLAKMQSEELAKTMTELTDTMEACGCTSDSAPMRNFAKSLMDISQSLLMGGGK